MIAEAVGVGLASGIIWGILRARIPDKWLTAGALVAVGILTALQGRFPLIQDTARELGEFALSFAVFLPSNILTHRYFTIKPESGG